MEADFHCSLCPVQEDAREIHTHSQGLVAAMRKLRRDLQDCPQCPRYHNCPILKSFNAAVDTAIQGIVEEWNLR